MCLCVFFFKQKTAYEMRISDWSSDVCSSDLTDLADLNRIEADGRLVENHHRWTVDDRLRDTDALLITLRQIADQPHADIAKATVTLRGRQRIGNVFFGDAMQASAEAQVRSEEHTSEPSH